MNVTVYAITYGRTVPDIPGLLSIRVGLLIALVANARRRPAPSPANLRQYHKTIAAIADVVPAVLPVRYGTLMTRPELAIVLHARAQSLLSTLRRVRGRVQMTVRLTGIPTPRAATGTAATRRGGVLSPPRAKAVKASPGLAYLRALAEREHEISGFDAVRTELQSWISDERVERFGDVVTVYHLVPRRSAATYARTAVRSIAESGLRGVVSGPFPPYAFSVW